MTVIALPPVSRLMAARALRAAVVIGRRGSGSSSGSSDIDSGAPLLSASWSDSLLASSGAGGGMDSQRSGGQYRPKDVRRKSVGGGKGSGDTSDFLDVGYGRKGRRGSSGASSIGMQFNDSIIRHV